MTKTSQKPARKLLTSSTGALKLKTHLKAGQAASAAYKTFASAAYKTAL